MPSSRPSTGMDSGIPSPADRRPVGEAGAADAGVQQVVDQRDGSLDHGAEAVAEVLDVGVDHPSVSGVGGLDLGPDLVERVGPGRAVVDLHA